MNIVGGTMISIYGTMSSSYGTMSIIGGTISSTYGTMSILDGTMSNGKCVCVLSKESQLLFTKLQGFQGLPLGLLDNHGQGTQYVLSC